MPSSITLDNKALFLTYLCSPLPALSFADHFTGSSLKCKPPITVPGEGLPAAQGDELNANQATESGTQILVVSKPPKPTATSTRPRSKAKQKQCKRPAWQLIRLHLKPPNFEDCHGNPSKRAGLTQRRRKR